MSKKKCVTPYCRNAARGGRRYCHKCESRKYKESNPLRYYYNITKQAARQRGKVWELSFEDYTEFCSKTGYHDGRGRTPASLTIDRIDPSKGYTRENIRCLSHSQNSTRRDLPPDADDMSALPWYEDDPEYDTNTITDNCPF